MKNLTKDLIVETFYKMLKTKTINEIKVTNLVKECGINRQTFYYHFLDIYDLMEYSLVKGAGKYAEDHGEDDSTLTRLRTLYEYLYENKNIIIHAYDPVNRINYELFINRHLKPIIEKIIEDNPISARVSPEDREFVCDFYVVGLSGIVLRWIEDGMYNHFEDSISKVLTILDSSIGGNLEEFAKKN